MPDSNLEPTLLDRAESRTAVERHFGGTVQLADEVADYGAHLVVRCLATASPATSERELVDLIVLGVFVKHVVAMLDAVAILAREGASLAARIQGRSLFEASAQAEWVLAADSKRRARAYYTWDLRQQRLWHRRLIPGTEEHERFRSALADEYADPTAGDPALTAQAIRRTEEIAEHLARPEFAELNAEFDRLRNDRPHDAPWYRALSMRSLRSIAQSLGRMAEYEVFYSISSHAVHASSYRDHFQVRDGTALFTSIRDLDGLAETLRFSLTAGFRTFRATLAHYRPGELSAFNRKYMDEWRLRFRNIPHVTVKRELAPQR